MRDSPAACLVLHPQHQAPSRSTRNVPRHMPSFSCHSLRGDAHHLPEAAIHGTEVSSRPGRAFSLDKVNIPDARLLQDRTSRPSRPYILLPCPGFSSDLSEAISRDRGYHIYQRECGANSNAHQNSSGPSDTGTPSQACEVTLSAITVFDQTSSAGARIIIYSPLTSKQQCIVLTSESSGLFSATQDASQCLDPSLRPLKYILSSKSGRRSLYALPRDRATKIIEDLERVGQNMLQL